MDSEIAIDQASGQVPEGEPLGKPLVMEEPQLSVPRRAINKASEIRRRLPKSLKLKLKILFSFVMFASLPFVLKVDLHKTWQAAVHANLWILGATTVAFIASYLLNARRWQILVEAVGFKNKTFVQLAEYCYVGLFFNLFLPSTVGGDFTRCYYLAKGTSKHADAFYSVIADRASGLAVLFATAACGLLLGPGARDLPWQLKWPIFLGTFGIFAVMPLMPKLTRKFLGEQNWLTRQFNNSGANVFWQDKPLVASAVAWSVLTQMILVFCHVGVAFSLGLGDKIPMWYYFVFYPCVAVLGFVTPSFNGIGIREWAYTYFLMLFGVERSSALTFALIWLTLTTLVSLFGGVVYVVSKLTPPPRQEEE
jgi:uncharacterized membrane protein YbhN (UPF0104 family)